MRNKELLLISSSNNSIQLPFISGSGVDPYCYISFTNDSPYIAAYITSHDSSTALAILPGDYQSSTKTAVPNTDAINVINTLLGRDTIPNNMYICGILAVYTANGQARVNIISPSEGGFIWDVVYLPSVSMPDAQVYIIGISSGQYQPIEGLTAMYINIS